MAHESMEIDERLKEIKMSQLNESKFPPENLILNPLKDKENQNILNEINSYLDRNEKDNDNKLSKKLIEGPNFSSKHIINSEYLLNDLNIKKTNNCIDTSQHNNLSDKIASKFLLNNSIIENNNLNNSSFLNSNMDINIKNPNLYQNEINRHNKNSFSMIESIVFINPNDTSVNLDLNTKKISNIQNNINNNPQNLDSSIYIIKEGKLCNNNLLNKSVASVNDEFNKSVCDKKTYANSLLEFNNNLKNNFYQSVGNKTENDLKREKLILDKITHDIQKTEIIKNQEKAKLISINLKKEEEIYLKSEIKKLTNKLDILKKDKEQQEKTVKEAEAKLILKFELELKKRLENERNAKFNTLTNNQLNNSMFNHLNFHSTSNNINNNNMNINKLNLSINTTPDKIDKLDNLININNSAKAEKLTNKQNEKINEKLVMPCNNIEINITNNKNKIEANNTHNNINKNKPIINPEFKFLEELRYENEEKERLIHFENLEKEMLMEKINTKSKEFEIEKEKQELEKIENQGLIEKHEKETLEKEKKKAEKLEKIRLENQIIEKDNKDKENREKALKEKIETEDTAELIKKLEEEKQQRILFEDKIKHLETDKKPKDIENKLQPKNPTLDNLQVMEIKIMKNSEIINQELSNSFGNKNNSNVYNYIGKSSFKFDLLDNKSTLNRNANKFGEMNFNLSSVNNSILNDSKDKIKSDNKSANFPDNSINNPLSKNNQFAHKKQSIYSNLNNSHRENSKDSMDQPRKSFDDIKMPNNISINNQLINNALMDNDKESGNRRKSDSSIITNNFANSYINYNPNFNRPNNAANNSICKEDSRNNSFNEDKNNNINLDINFNNLNKIGEKENKKIGCLNSSILSERDNNNKEKYNFKSFIFANKSADSDEKPKNNKEIKSIDLKSKQEVNESYNNIDVNEVYYNNKKKVEENLEQNKQNNHNNHKKDAIETIPDKRKKAEIEEPKTQTKEISENFYEKENNKVLLSNIKDQKETRTNSKTLEKKDSTLGKILIIFFI